MSGAWIAILVLLVVTWFAACLLVRHVVIPWLGRQCGGDALSAAMLLVIRPYCRLVHRLRVEGCTALRQSVTPGPLIVVSNHTGGIDPLLIQSSMRCHIRWMMERRMMHPALGWLWRQQGIIPVDFDAGDAGAARTAMAHVRDGGVLGIFPEGGLARPPETIHPFLPGVGLLVARTGAPVLLCWIHGTPKCDRAWDSFVRPSRSTLHFLEVIRYPARTKPAEITGDLRRRLAEASGWPLIPDARRQADRGTASGRGAVVAS